MAERKARQAIPLSPQEDGNRRIEILNTAAALFGASGFRTSLSEIAQACGILAGSLYHHFESKEAIVVELVRRYFADLDRIASVALADLKRDTSKPDFERIAALAEDIAACAVRHRAALLLTVHDSAVDEVDGLTSESRRALAALDGAMRKILRVAEQHGYLRKNIDTGRLAERICRSMLNSGVGVFQTSEVADEAPRIRCRMLLEGIAVEVPKNAELNRSKAFVAAQQAINGWNGGELDDGRLGQLRAAARAEFGRRGYEATTIRDIAAAAGMSMGSVYRLIGSKDELLAAIMERFRNGAVSSWDAVLDAKATPVEKLDALLWVNINLLARFSEEFKIQFAWLRQSPPTSAFAINQITGQMYHVRTLLADGERRGYFRVIGKSAGVRAGCLFGLTFTAAAVGRGTRPQDALELGRNTLLRGAAVGV